MKDSFLPHDSTKIEPFFTIEKHGVEVWNAGYDLEDGDIAVSQAALAGADLWFEPRLREMIFMSGELVAAIRQARVNLDFSLAECRIVGERG